MYVEFKLTNPEYFNERWIKQRASRICNQNFDAVDELFINFDKEEKFLVSSKVPRSYTYHYVRVSKVCPNNTITRGQWK